MRNIHTKSHRILQFIWNIFENGKCIRLWKISFGYFVTLFSGKLFQLLNSVFDINVQNGRLYLSIKELFYCCSFQSTIFVHQRQLQLEKPIVSIVIFFFFFVNEIFYYIFIFIQFYPFLFSTMWRLKKKKKIVSTSRALQYPYPLPEKLLHNPTASVYVFVSIPSQSKLIQVFTWVYVTNNKTK